MAKLIPEPTITPGVYASLVPGQSVLLEALEATLDDEWTIFVQPFLNGIQPDFLIFSPSAGIGLFEVSDLDLNEYRVSSDGIWEQYDLDRQQWLVADIGCPLARVKRYKDSITTYELPDLDAAIVLDDRYYALFSTFVYFHHHTTQEAAVKTGPLQEKHSHTSIFGHDFLSPKLMSQMLGQRYLKKGSRFTEFMREVDLQNRLYNAMAHPEYGRLDKEHISFTLNKDQQRLMPSEPGGKRVVGSAGSGKSLVLARKAVAAAKDGNKVLLVCYNITMTNYLYEIIRRLAYHESGGGGEVERRILVRHYHRLFPDGWDLDDPDVRALAPFDVVLIDEGQDFFTEWIANVFELTSQSGHRMFVEDDRQNIYGIDLRTKRQVRGIVGRPLKLKGTFRLNDNVAKVANRLISFSKQTFESEDLEPIGPQQYGLYRPIWIEGAEENLLAALAAEIRRLIESSAQTAPADIVILVCSYEDGWKVLERLEALGYPSIFNFETRDERKRLEKQYSGERLKLRLDNLRRARKLGFWMRSDRIKVCTIHSFKGWELRRVLVLFNPTGPEQEENRIPLLYTAITRSLESLMVLNADPQMIKHGQNMAQEGLIDRRVALAQVVEES